MPVYLSTYVGVQITLDEINLLTDACAVGALFC